MVFGVVHGLTLKADLSERVVEPRVAVLHRHLAHTRRVITVNTVIQKG